MLSPLSLSCLLLHFFVVFATEFTFELPDNDKLCFYEELEKDVKFDIDYQVISGGNYDVDCFVTDPLDNILYNENKKQYDSFSHTTAMRGTYRVCFSNEFSTFSHKSIYLDFRHGDEDPLLPGMTRATALTHVRQCYHHGHQAGINMRVHPRDPEGGFGVTDVVPAQGST
ncbi:transmembrane emp24 domain-containing protein 3 isoform X3 [Phyllopteryx taeniolatus]|uniref:transmembrane emp24 domain-containing protein 3 isoform X3 n=1 Tax=Phyllopteryx taeniolatus TaxID=161469 RepID=UPI002AD556EF|nr:transmembrane emp24 domain-containing protein 3 isoform X3 [Phyllopteryx taeniolatus]